MRLLDRLIALFKGNDTPSRYARGGVFVPVHRDGVIESLARPRPRQQPTVIPTAKIFVIVDNTN